MEPTENGYFGTFGGRFVPEVLVPALEEVERYFHAAKGDPEFWAAYNELLRDFVGRPSPLMIADRFRPPGGAQIVLKREDLNHTGAHKINNTIGQGLLAQRMSKRRILAETGAGQHGVATATIGAKLGLDVHIYMGARDIERQAPNVRAMRLLGATVHPVTSGTQTLKDATNEAFRQWAAQVNDAFYIIGSAVGAHPYPLMVREFQRVIGDEARRQALERFGELPQHVVACVGGGSNAIGMFTAFLRDETVRIWGAEAAGEGLNSGKTAASIGAGTVGILHGSRSYIMQTLSGQTLETHSVSAGLDYPGIGPEHAYLHESGRVSYVPITDFEALSAYHRLAETEGIIPAVESAHALAYAYQLAQTLPASEVILVCLSGRGDKDIAQVAEYEEHLAARAGKTTRIGEA
jgi:tryptophan synthase beta chain